ncbi:N-formylglutamate amidohydrolase [Bacillus sp. NTK071]|uniref:N-formylglutamate amidohydrolase n=1 Tax=Bacillus sp. NTK071 TaxID=2802175 RepID=UPI001A8F8F7D|nr:N-formylglutamate amidohydrolase [Bacillus sp. NTK071]MBN8209836.1 N-formylglutamate amidohydrolase [Bacillus sp. NTK071]
MKVNLQEVLELEDQFSQHKYHGAIQSNEFTSNKEGVLPILISAPHATKHWRNGRVKSADIYTGSIALLLYQLTGCHVMVKTKIGEDPNYVVGGEYKEILSEFCRTHSIHTIIDLHGASSEHSFDIEMGSNFGESLSDDKARRIAQVFQNHRFKVALNGTFAASHKGTITNYVSQELGIDAVQLEINKEYRNPRNELELFLKMVDCLRDIVTTVGNHGESRGRFS